MAYKGIGWAKVVVYLLMAMMGALFLLMIQYMLKQRVGKQSDGSVQTFQQQEQEQQIIQSNIKQDVLSTEKKQQEQQLEMKVPSKTASSSLNSEYEYWLRNYIIKSDPHLLACHNDIGFGLVERWRKAERLICGNDKNPQNTRVYMYRIQQTRHTAKDNFVRIRNFIASPDTFSGSGFSQGWFSFGCAMNVDDLKRSEGHNLFQMHLDRWMTQYKGQKQCSKKINRRVVFLQRDGEYNLFHSMTDFSSMFVNYLMIIFKRIEEEGTNVADTMDLLEEFVANTDVVYLDNYKLGPYMPILQSFGTVYSYSEYSNYLEREYEVSEKTLLCFDEVLFATPGGSNFLFKDAWRPNQCKDSDVLKVFSRFVTKGVLKEDHLTRRRGIPAKDPIRIVFSTRSFKPGQKIGRRVTNEEELHQALIKDPVLGSHNLEIKFLDFGTLGSIQEQMKVVRNTDILIGAHGAGLTHSLFLPEESVVVELFFIGFHSSFFRNMAKWRGIHYLAYQNEKEENVVDRQAFWTKIDTNDFVQVVRSAVSIAETFHLGPGVTSTKFDVVNEHHHL